MTKNQILKKVRKIEESKSFRSRCIEAGICPLCGGSMVEIGVEPHPFLTQYKCKECGIIETQ